MTVRGTYEDGYPDHFDLGSGYDGVLDKIEMSATLNPMSVVL